MQHVRQKLLTGLRSYASVRFVTQITSWVGTVFVVRHLDSLALGRFGVALVVFNYLSMTFDGTFVEALVQRPPTTPEERRAVFTLVAGIGLALGGATIALSGIIARWVGDAAVGPLVVGVALTLALTSLCVIPQSLLARSMAFARLATIGAVQALSVTAITVVLALRGAGAWALLWGQVGGVTIRLLLLNMSAEGFARPTIRIGQVVDYLRVGGVLFIDNLLWRWYTSLDTFLLGRWAGTGALGYYSLAQQLAELPLEKISTVVNDVSLPAYAELRETPVAARELLLETLRAHATIGFPIFWGLAVVAPLAVPILFGRRWDLAIFPLVALAMVAPLRLIGSIETPAMTGLGRPGVLLKTKLVVAPAMTVALLIGCRLDGIEGAALAWVTVFPVTYAIAFRYVLQTAAISYHQVFAVLRGPAVAAALMVATVFVWYRIILPTGTGHVTGLATSVAVGVAGYTTGLRMIDPSTFRLARARVSRFLGLQRVA